MSQRTNEGDIAAVTETVRAYYDGMMTGDEAKLGRAFHPRACIVGNEHGELSWATLDEFVAECKKAVAQAGTPRMANRGPLVRRRHRPGQARRPVRRRVVQRRPVHAPDRRRLAHRSQDVLPTPRNLMSKGCASRPIRVAPAAGFAAPHTAPVPLGRARCKERHPHG
jgi:Putative lumazine-binding